MRPRTPSVVVIHDGNDWDFVFGGRIEFKETIRDSRITGDNEDRGSFVWGLRSYSSLYRRTSANHHREIGTDRIVLVGATNLLSGTEGAQPASAVTSNHCTPISCHRQLRINVSPVKKIMSLLGNHRRVEMIGSMAVFQSQGVIVKAFLLKGLPCRSQFSQPRFPCLLGELAREGFQKCPFIPHNPEIEGPVPSEILSNRMDANCLHVWIETKLSRTWHTVLTDKDNQIGAHQCVWRKARRQTVVIRKMTLHGPSRNYCNVLPLRCRSKRIPAFALEHALPTHDNRTI